MAELLSPHNRSLYTGVLRPPSGHVFDQALAATYSLDLPTLLTVPVNLLLFGSDDGAAPFADGIATLEALRRVSSRILVFCQEAQIIVPSARHILYGMLEPMVCEVRAPGGGVFHPKLWVIRFKTAEGDALIRLAILSRNLTRDRSWDLSLVVEGKVGRETRQENGPLASLVAALPAIAKKALPGPWPDRLRDLAGELMRAEFELPEGFERLSFHILGMGGGGWLPGNADELVAISPFLSEKTLRELAGATRKPLALISRQEELAALDAASLEAFERKYVLNENIEAAEELATSEYPSALRGLHAKAYIFRKGSCTSIVTGSANATDAAFLHGSNVEILAELTGRCSRVGKPEEVLSGGDLGEILVPYDPNAQVDAAEASKRKEVEKALGKAKREICEAGLGLVCRQKGGRWDMTISAREGFRAGVVEKVKAWPVTLAEESARDVTPVLEGGRVMLADCAVAHLTGFIAFEAVPRGFAESVRFVLNLPVEGMPEERGVAVMHEIIANRDGFLRYLLLLLGDIGEEGLPGSLLSALKAWDKKAGGSWDDLPLLEELVAAACKDAGRLKQVKKLMDDLLSAPGGGDLIPEDFLSLWRVFEESCLKEEARDA